nr:MAG TPA: hypothetical protein [Caudoviricetes sp.]
MKFWYRQVAQSIPKSLCNLTVDNPLCLWYNGIIKRKEVLQHG